MGKLESRQFTIREPFNQIKNLNFEDDDCKIGQYIKKRMANNDISKIMNPELLRDTFNIDEIIKLQYWQPTSCVHFQN